MIIFVVSYQRTGSTVICDVLGQHSQLISLNDNRFWEDRVRQGGNLVIHPNAKETPLPYLLKTYPYAKFISLNRNPLDIAASYKRLSIIRGKGGKNEKNWLARVKEYREFLKERKQFEDRPNFLVIDFEDVILQEFKTFKRIFDFLGLEFEVLTAGYITDYISNDPVKNYPGLAFSTSPNKKVDGYKNVLTPQEIKRIVK